MTEPPADDLALANRLALTHQRRPQDGQVWAYDAERETFIVIRARSFCVRAEGDGR